MMNVQTKIKPARCPTHPGEILREDVLPALNLSIATAAAELGISRQALHKIIAGTSGISTEMALRIGKWCGNGPDLWLSMQQAHDLWHAEQKMIKTLAAIPSHTVV
jgi:antitoxin HigA-1